MNDWSTVAEFELSFCVEIKSLSADISAPQISVFHCTRLSERQAEAA
jgi:hypothetical protein